MQTPRLRGAGVGGANIGIIAVGKSGVLTAAALAVVAQSTSIAIITFRIVSHVYADTFLTRVISARITIITTLEPATHALALYA